MLNADIVARIGSLLPKSDRRACLLAHRWLSQVHHTFTHEQWNATDVSMTRRLDALLKYKPRLLTLTIIFADGYTGDVLEIVNVTGQVRTTAEVKNNTPVLRQLFDVASRHPISLDVRTDQLGDVNLLLTQYPTVDLDYLLINATSEADLVEFCAVNSARVRSIALFGDGIGDVDIGALDKVGKVEIVRDYREFCVSASTLAAATFVSDYTSWTHNSCTREFLEQATTSCTRLTCMHVSNIVVRCMFREEMMRALLDMLIATKCVLGLSDLADPMIVPFVKHILANCPNAVRLYGENVYVGMVKHHFRANARVETALPWDPSVSYAESRETLRATDPMSHAFWAHMSAP